MDFNLGRMAEEHIQSPAAARGATRPHRPPAPWLALGAADVLWYRICDDLSGVIIFAMLVFSPWAFGTTQPWSIWTMNFAGYALGLLLLVKVFLRQAKGYPAMRWDGFSAGAGTHPGRAPRAVRRLTRALAGLTFVLLGYCVVAAVNASADYNPQTQLFEYHSYLGWLPHSFDRQRTWFYFWMYLGLAGSFWASWDWLSGLTPGEARAARGLAEPDAGGLARRLPDRLRWLLWLLCVNGAILGLEGIVQRLSGSSELLFLVQPHVVHEGEHHFGAYAYRSNAAQYFNLVWPLGLGLWWTLQRSGGQRGGTHHLLLFCTAIMAACPIISTTRGGALVAVTMLVVAVIYLSATSLRELGRRTSEGSAGRGTHGWLLLFFVLVLGLGWYFGWALLAPRMEQLGQGFEGRDEMFDMARPMARDYPVFGTGPGTFATVFQLYRISNSTYWPEQLHNDWLETRITFGWVGLALLLAAVGCVGLRWLAPGRIRAGRRLVVLGWLALAGCFVHAYYDFPFQIYSIVLLFLVVCAILFSVSGRSSRR